MDVPRELLTPDTRVILVNVLNNREFCVGMQIGDHNVGGQSSRSPLMFSEKDNLPWRSFGKSSLPPLLRHPQKPLNRILLH